MKTIKEELIVSVETVKNTRSKPQKVTELECRVAFHDSTREFEIVFDSFGKVQTFSLTFADMRELVAQWDYLKKWEQA